MTHFFCSVCIEIKSSLEINSDDCAVVAKFARDAKGSRTFVISRDPTPRTYGNVSCIPWTSMAKEIW